MTTALRVFAMTSMWQGGLTPPFLFNAVSLKRLVEGKPLPLPHPNHYTSQHGAALLLDAGGRPLNEVVSTRLLPYATISACTAASLI